MSVQELDSLNQSDEPAREWATKLQTAHNWAEVLMQLSQLKADFRDQVWKFWQLDIFEESDFPSKVKAEESQELHR
ncbi:MAG: hypothetical protein KME25_07965 [Symplocastrum torsivum CPER-KK1]|jgi:hypothetical protein|uniref:Uncharacterized protein n=1 Tax=Symplocastrum torsivum CPER-KK1 TaxID=450513 RepID=A0A951U920_9CYAN|nr:hypothetical protein [Symplocastrum torsivum CPER-KK1]